jgi:hypothetical protein
MLSSRRPIPLLTAIIALAACDPSAVAPTAPVAELPSAALFSSQTKTGADRSVEESLYDMSGSQVPIGCDDTAESELVALEGQIYERFTVLFNPAGGFHAGYHTMPVGLRGVGTVSGEEFRVKEQDHGSYNQTLMGAVGTYRQSIRLAGRTTGRSFEVTVKGHYTVNANGELSVQREKAVFACES